MLSWLLVENAESSARRAERYSSRGFGAGIIAVLLIGGLYYLWVGNVLYRRLTECDRLVGSTPTRIAFHPFMSMRAKAEFPYFRLQFSVGEIPAQAVVVGPPRSGKTELLRSIPSNNYPLDPNEPTLPTRAPVITSFPSRPYEVVAVDCGGEFMGEQFDILRTVRTDCMVVVCCALHFTDDTGRLEDDRNWELENVASLIDNQSSKDFFQALYYATHRSSTGALLSGPTRTDGATNADDRRSTPTQNDESRESSDAVQSSSGATAAINVPRHAPVQRVLVVLNNRDHETAEPDHFDDIPVYGLVTLARTIFNRFAGGVGDSEPYCAAVKAKINVSVVRERGDEFPGVTPDDVKARINVGVDKEGDYSRVAVPGGWTANLREGANFIGWGRALAGDWHDGRGQAVNDREQGHNEKGQAVSEEVQAANEGEN